MFASVNLPLRHKVQKFSSGTGSPVCSWKNGCGGGGGGVVVFCCPFLDADDIWSFDSGV